MHPVVRQFVRAAGSGASDTSDPDLVKRFVEAADQAAFTELVRRHGPMVLDVCRCVLGNHADAEDAFQATFLALARQAGSIRRAGSLAAWLHGVAYRTARKARARAARRREHEAKAPAREPATPDDLTWAEVRLAVHEALAALGERYRAPLVLCYLGGLTQDRAAAALGLSAAALKKRLERGREKLREQLARKGLGPTALLAALATPALASAVPPGAAEAVARLAPSVAAGGVPAGAVSPAVLSLVHAEVTPMVLSPLKAVLCVLPVLVAGAVLAGASGQPETRAQDPAPLAPVRADDEKGKEETPARKEAKWLAGEWKVVFVEAGGKSLFDHDISEFARIVFKDGKAEVKDLRVLFMRDFSFTLDPTKNPKEIDVTLLEGGREGETFEGVYVTLENEVRICLRLASTDLGRPRGFKTGAGAGLYTFFLRPAGEKEAPPVKPAPPAKPKDPLPAEAGKSLTARLVVGDPVPIESVEGARTAPVLIEIANPHWRQVSFSIDPRDVKLQLIDDAGEPVPESRLTRGWVVVFGDSVAGVVPAGGYTGFPIPRGNVVIPRHVLTLAPGYQDWALKPGKYTLRGTVTLRVREVSDRPEARAGREPQHPGAGASVKLDLKPVAFEVAAK